MTNSEHASYIKGLMDGMELDPNEDEEECGCGHHHHGHGHGSCGCGCHHHDQEAVFEAICPNCGETIELTEEVLEAEKMLCPSCGETLEFDFDEDELEELEELEPSEEPGEEE